MDKRMTVKRLVIYLVLAFALAWGFEFLFIAKGFRWDLSSRLVSLVSLGMLAPAMAHFLTRAVTKEGFKLAGKDSMMLGIDLSGGRWKLFLFAIFIPVIYSTASDALECAVVPGAFDGGALTRQGMPDAMALLYPLNAVVSGVFISFAAFGEEFGWRAYMMPKLNALMGRYKALLAGGIIWGLWHAPLTCIGHNFGTDYPGFPYVGIVIMCIYCILLGTVLTYVTEKTGSIWPAAFLHGVNNAMPSFLTVFMRSQGNIFAFVLCMLIPLLIVAGFCLWRGRKTVAGSGS